MIKEDRYSRTHKKQGYPSDFCGVSLVSGGSIEEHKVSVGLATEIIVGAMRKSSLKLGCVIGC